jgi:[protein-PII] uridylyltransferase
MLKLPPPPSRQNQSRKEAVTAYKKYLRVQEQRIRMRHNGGADGIEVAGARARLLDAILTALYEHAVTGTEGAAACPPFALVATGGYGRGLLNPHSDIDLLFLHRMPQPSARLKEAIEEILYMLWDIGFKLGHAVRNIPEAIQQGNSDFQTLSAHIESRPICGDMAIYDEFMAVFRKKSIKGREDIYLDNRLQDLKDRHTKQLNTIYVQEPNVKNGVGGLRDYHNAVWTTFVKLGSTDLRVCVEHGLLSATAYKQLQNAYAFVLRVRNSLHYAEGRARDVLTLYLQGVVATDFKYPQRTMVRRCEAFMRDYYSHTRSIRQITSQILEGFDIERVRRTRKRGIISFLARKRPAREEFDGFYHEDGRCYPVTTRVFKEDPQRLIRLFQHTQLRHLRLAPELKSLIESSYGLIDKSFRYNKAARTTFEAILSRRGDVGRALRQMHRVGVLGRYLPEFGGLDCLVQHEFFHRYTADEHTLRTIDMLDALADTTDPALATFRNLFQEIEDPFILYLALLMHDTGRAENARHHEDASAVLASRLCARHQISGSRRRLLLFLVDHHLTFWKTATTKNLEDPNTIAEFASIVRGADTLKYLYLLTYADANGTSEESWNGWKATLMRGLYKHTLSYLEDQEAFRRRLEFADPNLKQEVTRRLPENFAREIDVHFHLMPERYFRTRGAETISNHLKVFREFFTKVGDGGSAAIVPAVHWEARPEEGCSKVIVVSWNRPLLLARLSACFSAQGLNILAADIFTRGDDLAMDVFRVCTTNWEPVTNPRTLKNFTADLERVFTTDDYNSEELIGKGASRRRGPDPRLPAFPVRVYISNDVDPRATFIEIQALDRLGLLHDVFRTLGRAGLEVDHARINTTKGAAIDTFYTTLPGGHKLTDPDALQRLQSDLETAIGILADPATS